MNVWRLMVTGARDGALNMAIDEALMASARRDGSPTVRFYGWRPPCLSLGRFQRYEGEVDEAACREAGVDVVRRPTGGRLILHEHEVTYSLVAREDDPLVAGPIADSYARISAALLAGLRRLGVEAELAGKAARGAPARTRFGACFDSSSDYEIVAGGRKIVGSAQWRREGAVLQHGCVLLRADPDRLYRLALPPSGLTARDAARHFRTRVAGLEELAGRSLAFDEVSAALADGFAKALGTPPLPGELSDDEWAIAVRLRAEKYASREWTRERIDPTAARPVPTSDSRLVDERLLGVDVR